MIETKNSFLIIETSDAGAVDRVHDLGESAWWASQHQVIVAVHSKIGADDRLESFGGTGPGVAKLDV